MSPLYGALEGKSRKKCSARNADEPREYARSKKTFSDRIVLVIVSLVLAAAEYSSRDSARGALRVRRDFAPLILLGAFSLLITLAGCGRSVRKSSAHVPAPPQPARIGSTETGIASWYGYPYHGRPTASGEIYDMEQLTAAHRTLPFQTWLDVTNLSNGKHVEVRVTDRGPFVDGRILDLSHAAAREIGMLGTGTAKVRLKVIAPPVKAAAKTAPPAVPPEVPSTGPSEDAERAPVIDATRPATSIPAGRYAVQAGAFADRSRAEALAGRLTTQLGPTFYIRVAGPAERSPLWRVLIGQGMSLDEAKVLAEKVRIISGAALVVSDVNTPDTTPQGIP